MNILFFQHGDYAEAYLRFLQGGPETYGNQRATVNFVAGLAKRHCVTTVAVCDDPHDTELAPGLRSIGLRYGDLSRERIADLFTMIQPDRLVCRTPNYVVLREAKRRSISTLPCFADTFSSKHLKSIYRNVRLRKQLTGAHIPCVSNHSLNACRSIAVALLYPRNRIVPRDWSKLPVHETPKLAFADRNTPTVFFAGMLSEAKGVGVCLQALRILKGRGRDASFSFAGPGDIAFWSTHAAALGVAENARFLGRIPNSKVRENMRTHDIVVVPSQHSYSEGLPKTINEALSSRTPLIISDHPAFRGRLKPERDALVFKASDPHSLADALDRLCRDQALYALLSENAAKALESLYVGMQWEDLIGTFLKDPENRTGWVQRNSLAALDL